jgi:hypothetical protein
VPVLQTTFRLEQYKMIIEYNNGKNSKLIKNVKHITVVDYFIIALLENDKELKISLNNIESIVDDTILLRGNKDAK